MLTTGIMGTLFRPSKLCCQLFYVHIIEEMTTSGYKVNTAHVFDISGVSLVVEKELHINN